MDALMARRLGDIELGCNGSSDLLIDLPLYLSQEEPDPSARFRLLVEGYAPGRRSL